MIKLGALAMLYGANVVLLMAFDRLAMDKMASYGFVFQFVVYVAAVLNAVLGYETAKRLIELPIEE